MFIYLSIASVVSAGAAVLVRKKKNRKNKLVYSELFTRLARIHDEIAQHSSTTASPYFRFDDDHIDAQALKKLQSVLSIVEQALGIQTISTINEQKVSTDRMLKNLETRVYHAEQRLLKKKSTAID